ncbi:MAG TPA: serine/threonine-protein kinase [Polyangiaceae bacterium]|nr:serine/threonine-protein kinase [Polyangiaceae bacterium]
MIGTNLDERYRIEAELGAGGVGTVYRGLHLALGKPVAVKILKPELAASAALRQRFEREARALALLSHPHIVRILDSGVTDVAYLVMDLLQGETLSERLKRGRMPLREAAGVLRQLLSALVYVHEQGLIHRDVKPANVFLEVAAPGQPPNVRLLDFGLAKFVAPEAGERALTRAGQVFGTPSYMAPEQIAGQTADARADVYATGIVFFTMLAGRTPFQGDDSEILRKHVMDDLPMSALPSESATTEVVALLKKATAKTRAERFASAAEMLAALDAAVAALPPLAGPDDPTVDQGTLAAPRADTATRKLFRLGATVATLVSLLGVLGAAFAVYVFVSPGHEKERKRLEDALALPSAKVRPASSAPRAGTTPFAMLSASAGAAASAAPAVASVGSARTADFATPVPPAASGAPEEPAPAPASSASPPSPKDRPPSRNPWTTIPAELGRFLTKVSHGRGLEKKELVQVHQYNGKHPEDPRGHLLLARSYTNRHWVKDAVNEYEIALTIDPSSRGDARMLPDLVKNVGLGSGEGGRLVSEWFGSNGLPAVEKAVAAAPNPEAKARLERLATELRTAPPR